MAPKVFLDAQGHIEVLRGAAVPAPDAPHEIGAEHPEGPRDVVDGVELVEPDAARMDSQHVLQGLKTGRQGMAGVAHPQIARDGHDAGFDEVSNGTCHHVVIEGGIAIDGHDDVAGRGPKAEVRA